MKSTFLIIQFFFFFENLNNSNKKLLTQIFFKPTDTHALLHKTSYHPKHKFRGIVKSQIIRFYRISSREADMYNSISILFKSLRKRGYSRRFLRTIKRDTVAALAPTCSQNGPPTGAAGQGHHEENTIMNLDKTVPLVTTYSKLYLPLQNQLKNNFEKFMLQHD